MKLCPNQPQVCLYLCLPQNLKIGHSLTVGQPPKVATQDLLFDGFLLVQTH